jgi:hypothetical protein
MTGWRVPRMVSLRSSGIPAHMLLLPSTIERHSSRAARSASLPEGSRCANSVLRASKGVPGGAGGIKRTRRERMSPGTRDAGQRMRDGRYDTYLWKGHPGRGLSRLTSHRRQIPGERTRHGRTQCRSRCIPFPLIPQGTTVTRIGWYRPRRTFAAVQVGA